MEKAGLEKPDQIVGVVNAGPENAGPNVEGVEKAGPPSIYTEREMDKYKMYNEQIISKQLSQSKKLLVNIT